MTFEAKVKGLVSLQVLNELLKTYGNNYEIVSHTSSCQFNIR